MRIILKGLAFGSRLLVSFLSRGKIWLKSILEKWAISGQFRLNVMSRSWDFYFWLLKRFGRFEAVASLDACQITNYQLPSKTRHFFCCLIFEEFKKKFLNQEFMAHCLSRHDQKVYLIFQNCAPRSTKTSYSNSFKAERECLSRWIYYQ